MHSATQIFFCKGVNQNAGTMQEKNKDVFGSLVLFTANYSQLKTFFS